MTQDKAQAIARMYEEIKNLDARRSEFLRKAEDAAKEWNDQAEQCTGEIKKTLNRIDDLQGEIRSLYVKGDTDSPETGAADSKRARRGSITAAILKAMSSGQAMRPKDIEREAAEILGHKPPNVSSALARLLKNPARVEKVGAGLYKAVTPGNGLSE